MIQPKLTKKQWMIATVTAVAVALGFGLGIYAFRGAIFAHQDEQMAPPVVSTEPAHRHPLTGEGIDQPLSAALQVFAVMIDHSVDAWPQSGVDDAFLVIEAPVEAGIPRLEAFFYEGQTVEKIGPVRSARPYFVDWADEFDAMYVHVGGSNAALDLIANNGTFDMNEFFHGSTFWRSTDRFAPHNTYTSTELLMSAIDSAREKGRAPDLLYGTWKFKSDEKTPPAVGIEPTVDFSAPTYRAEWKYDSASNRYRRTQAGLPYQSAEGDDVLANNVAVVVTDIEVIDDVGRRKIDTVGEGKAFVFQDGTAIEGTWKKASASERLRFYDATGNEIAMNAGKTWIEVVGSEDNLSY